MDYYQPPLTEEEEIYLEFPEYAKFVSREHDTKEEILALMLTSVVAHLTGGGMEPHSIYARRLAMKGDLITHNKDLSLIHI